MNTDEPNTKKAETAETTYQKMTQFRVSAPVFLKNNGGSKHPLYYAINKMIDKYTQTVAKAFQEEVEDNNRSFALEKDGEIQLTVSTDNRGQETVRYKYSKADQQKLDSAIRALQIKVITVPVYYPPEYKDPGAEIDMVWRKILTPFVLRPLTEEEEEKIYTAASKKEKETSPAENSNGKMSDTDEEHASTLISNSK